MDVNTNRSVNYVEYIFSCETRPSPDLSISLFIDGLWYTNNGPTSSISVVLSLSHLSPGEYNYLSLANSSLGIDADIAEYTTIGSVDSLMLFNREITSAVQTTANNILVENCLLQLSKIFGNHNNSLTRILCRLKLI